TYSARSGRRPFRGGRPDRIGFRNGQGGARGRPPGLALEPADEKRRAEAGSESGEIDEGGGPDAAAEDVETHPHQARGEKPDEEDRERLLADGADERDEPPPAQTLDEACPARSRRDPGQPETGR